MVGGLREAFPGAEIECLDGFKVLTAQCHCIWYPPLTAARVH